MVVGRLPDAVGPLPGDTVPDVDAVRAAAERAVVLALAEDLGVAVDASPTERRAADVTTVATVARDVLLDNFTPDACADAVAQVRDRGVLLEASGTLRLDTVRAYAATGVHRVAVGGVTHAAPQLDIALDLAAVAEG